MKIKEENPVLIFLICGIARQGKSTVAEFIQEYFNQQHLEITTSEFSKPLKEFAQHNFGWDGSDETKPRPLLCSLGTELIREELGWNDFFVKRAIEDIEILSHYFQGIIYGDVRFKIEIEEIKKVYPNVCVIEVVRNDFDNGLSAVAKSHPTETGLIGFKEYDVTILNDGTLEELKEKVYKYMEEITDEKNE